jgi:hypothetical protein
MKNISLTYDGEFPNLCSGTLTVYIGKDSWVFPKYALRSGGNVWFDDDWSEHVEDGEWSISEWPQGFPEEWKKQVVDLVNSEIPHGCCGGCV